MVSCLPSRSLVAAAFGLLAAGGVRGAQEETSVAELQRTIAALQAKNQALQLSLAESNASGTKAAEQLKQIRERLEALGKNMLDGGNDRLVHAAADLQVVNEDLTKLRDVSGRLKSSVLDYLRQAVVSDPDSRLRLETSLRELDEALGLGQKPRPSREAGSLQEATLFTIDTTSGLLVFNVGEGQGARIGMSFQLLRGNQPYGTAIIADVRKDVCGAFVERLDRPTESPRKGDTAILETQPNR